MSVVPTAVRPRVTRTELLAVVGTTLLFGLLLTTWAYVTPPLHGPDELANVDAALHLAIGQAWPAAGDLHYIQGLISQNVPALPPAAADRGSIAAIVGDGSVNELVNPMSQHPPTYFLGRRWSPTSSTSPPAGGTSCSSRCAWSTCCSSCRSRRWCGRPSAVRPGPVVPAPPHSPPCSRSRSSRSSAPPSRRGPR